MAARMSRRARAAAGILLLLRQRLWRGFHQPPVPVNRLSLEIPSLLFAVGPEDGHSVDALGLPNAEKQAAVAGGQVAGAALDEARPAPAVRLDHDPGADQIAMVLAG